MKVMITGHLGYIGAEMAPAMVAAGHDVTGLDTGYYDGCDFMVPPIDVPDLHLDIRDVEPRHLEGFDAVVHLAALSNDPLGDLNSQLTYDINLDASVSLARAAKQAGVPRFLFASSCSLYGAGGGDELDENAAFHPVTPYGESKVRVEQALSSLADGEFSPTYLRNATAYGVSRRLRSDIVVNNLVGHAVTTGKVLLQSDGSPWRPLVHIKDIIAAFVACLDAPRPAVHDEAFNVGKVGENYQIRDVANLVAEVVEGSEVTFAAGASADSRDYRVDFTKIAERLPGFEATVTLRDGIVEIYEAYQRGLTEADWNGPRFVRLGTIRGHLDGGRINSDLRWIS